MKTLWLCVCVLAIANLLAIGGFVGWLSMSGRLDADRLRAVRQVLTRTIAEEKAEKDAQATAASAERAAAAAAARAAQAPMTASERLMARIEATEIDEQRIAAMTALIKALQGPLQNEREAVALERQRLELDKSTFSSQVAAHNALIADVQFKKTVAVIDSLKSTDARLVLAEIIRGADATEAITKAAEGELKANADVDTTAVADAPRAPVFGAGMGRALDYLNAMQARTRSKVIAEFVKDDPALASQLLERLRTYGQVPLGTETSTRAASLP